jgi:hypothetical protein
MLTTLMQDSEPQQLVLTSTKLKKDFNKFKKNLDIFKNLNVNEKLGKKEEEGENVYYKVGNHSLLWISRWWYDEGRYKTIEYLDKDFSEFMEYLDNVIVELESDLFCKYKNLTKNIRTFIDNILVGLYNLKKTYPDCKEVVAKVDSIILTLIDFKDKSEAYVKQKNTNIKLLIGQRFNEV